MESFDFDLPKNRSSVIKVVGVGGGGNNAVNYMYNQGIEGVDFVICNTDAQALQNSPISHKLQLGASITEGLGAGANPEIGEQAALESKDEIKALFSSNTKLIFITAGMGGGTGTGAAPVIANIAREMGILTIGIVTYPFQFEGSSRLKAAEKGIEELRKSVDSLIVINNNKLRDLFGNLGYKSGFSKADEVLAKAAKGIAEVITQNYTINIDLRDAKTVLSNSGTAIMGSAQAQGENRAKEAIEGALDSPLLNDNKITGAQNVLLLIVSGNEEITIDEIGVINDFIQTQAGNNANIIMGIGEDESLENAISVTIVATGFPVDEQEGFSTTSSKKVYHTLRDEQAISKTLFEKDPTQPSPNTINHTNSGDTIQRHNLEEDFSEDNEPIDFVFSEKEKEKEEFQLDSNEEEDEFEFIVRDLADSTEEMEDFNYIPDEKIEKPEVEWEANQEKEDIAEDKDHGQITMFTLDDFEEEENTLLYSDKEEKQTEVKNELKKVETEEQDEAFSADMKKKIEERRNRLQQFNTQYENLSNNIDEVEKTPAYKRRGIELDESQNGKASKYYLDKDDDDIQLRPNNFFEDNVD